MRDCQDEHKGDLLLGAKAIAKHLGIGQRQTYRLIYAGAIPTFKLTLSGGVAARRSTLDAWLAEKEAEARKAQGDASKTTTTKGDMS